MKTQLCVPITANTPEGMAEEIARAEAAGADLLELRLDYLDLSQSFHKLSEFLDTMRNRSDLIMTCRCAEEGGHYRGDDDLRAKLLQLVFYYAGERRFVDLEYASYRRSKALHEVRQTITDGRLRAVRELGDTIEQACELDPELVKHFRGLDVELILSRHNFAGTPADVSTLFAEMANEHCDVLKVACKANTILDSLRVLDALHEWAPKRPTIALAMGEAGLITRVLARKLGAFLTFASLEAGKESAPGQPTIADMRNLYRWDQQTADTRVYGVIGCPVAHSMSPAMHNAAFDAVGHDGVYLPLRVEPDYETFAACLDGCLARPWLDFCGCSETIPHKENLLRYVTERGGEIEPLAKRLGVANTLVVSPEKGAGPCSGPVPLYACNTDCDGALDALCNGTGIERKGLKGLRVAVLGAGGASRAIVAGLCDNGCAVAIYNRTFEKAKALAEQFGATARRWDERGQIDAEVIVNTTSIGMWPKADETPLPELAALSGKPVVFDTVYNPLETRLLREARERGWKTIDGLGMLVHQAARQFKLWTGQPAPIELMDRIVRERLRGSH